MLHFSINVLISGLTRSIRSTSLVLHFNIPSGTVRVLVPPGTKHSVHSYKSFFTHPVMLIDFQRSESLGPTGGDLSGSLGNSMGPQLKNVFLSISYISLFLKL